MIFAIAIAKGIQGLQILRFCCIDINMTPNSKQSSLGFNTAQSNKNLLLGLWAQNNSMPLNLFYVAYSRTWLL